MIKKIYGEFQKKDGEIMGIASSEIPDRDGEVIRADGWDLSNYKKNPIIMANHRWMDFPIGKATHIAVEKGKLVFKMVLSNATKQAREAAQLINEGILKSFSVGFIPRERDKENDNIITKAELLEISLVSIPANPEAIIISKRLEKNEMAKDIANIYSTSQAEKRQDNEEKGAGRNIDKELVLTIKRATSALQNLCRELKKKGGEKK